MKLRHVHMNFEYMPQTGFSTCFFIEIDLPVEVDFQREKREILLCFRLKVVAVILQPKAVAVVLV